MQSGGAIYYDLFEPLGLESNIYEDNVAEYGQNYASYPFKLKILNDDLSFFYDLITGDTLKTEIVIGIFDQNDQLIVLENSNELQIMSDDIVL